MRQNSTPPPRLFLQAKHLAYSLHRSSRSPTEPAAIGPISTSRSSGLLSSCCHVSTQTKICTRSAYCLSLILDVITGLRVPFLPSHLLLGCSIREDAFSAHCYLSVISAFPVSHDGGDVMKRSRRGRRLGCNQPDRKQESLRTPPALVLFGLSGCCSSSIKAAPSAHATTSKCQPV